MADLPTIDSVLLAKYILAKSGGITHLKLQKLLYFVQAWHLAVFEKEIIRDDFEAWAHGPVSRKVWKEFKSDASPLYNTVRITSGASKGVVREVEATLQVDQLELIKDVLQEYGNKSSYYLECLTHREAPWIEARGTTRRGASCSGVISKSSMRRYYHECLYGKATKAKAASS